MKEAAAGLIMTAKHRILISIVFLKKYRYNTSLDVYKIYHHTVHVNDRRGIVKNDGE